MRPSLRIRAIRPAPALERPTAVLGRALAACTSVAVLASCQLVAGLGDIELVGGEMRSDGGVARDGRGVEDAHGRSDSGRKIDARAATLDDALAPPDDASSATRCDASCVNGTESCAVASCVAGKCVETEAPDGTACGTAPDVCHAAPVCKAGACQPAGALPDGTSTNAADPNARCCGGMAVETTSATNCGVCGLACEPSEACAVSGTIYVCTCSLDDCSLGCCSSEGRFLYCSPSNCSTGLCQTPDPCPGGSHCTQSVAGPTHCSY